MACEDLAGCVPSGTFELTQEDWERWYRDHTTEAYRASAMPPEASWRILVAHLQHVGSRNFRLGEATGKPTHSVNVTLIGDSRVGLCFSALPQDK